MHYVCQNSVPPCSPSVDSARPRTFTLTPWRSTPTISPLQDVIPCRAISFVTESVVLSRVRETASDITYEDSWAVAAAPGRQMPAWLLSVCFHAAVFLAFGLLAGSPESQPSTTPVRSAGIALVQRDPERVTYYSEAPLANRAGDGRLSPVSAQPGGPGASPFPALINCRWV